MIAARATRVNHPAIILGYLCGMVELTGSAAAPVGPRRQHDATGAHGRSHRGAQGFQQAVGDALTRHGNAAQPAVAQVPPTQVAPTSEPVPAEAALSQAMRLENVPDTWHAALRFIMQRESNGQVNATHPVHSARGLFQLTAANYHFNPNGVRSFGNAVEEARGGIRYIRQRYGTAETALAFWQAHRWY